MTDTERRLLMETANVLRNLLTQLEHPPAYHPAVDAQYAAELGEQLDAALKPFEAEPV